MLLGENAMAKICFQTGRLLLKEQYLLVEILSSLN